MRKDDVDDLVGQVSGKVSVPKGQNDSSLAVYCLGMQKKLNRPVRERYDWGGRKVLRP